MRIRPAPQPGFSRIDTLPEDYFSTTATRQLLVGEVVGGRYRLLERLGSGAMGDVYVAENLAIGLKVAVKVVKVELLNDRVFRHRFQREAEAIAAISHPNVARFLDLVVGDPTFLVMEYVPGPTIASRLRKSRLFPPARAGEITLALCRALRATHAAGIIHRDLKPLNVILAPDHDEGETPKLIDFGLAKVRPKPIETALTHAGQLVGTPNYMSPEQIAGKDVDERSDIYSLGCLMFELLTGRPPFVDKEAMRVLYKHVNEPPPTARSLVAEVPAALDDVAACALAKDPLQRFATMGDFAEALMRALRPSAPPASVAPHAPSPPQLPPPVVAPAWRRLVLVGAAVVVLASAAGFTVGHRRQAVASDAATLLVATTPRGAQVIVDGRLQPETTPTAVRELSPGRHTLTLKSAGRNDVTRYVELAAHERSLVEIVLAPRSRQIEVQTVPPEADVFVDHKLVSGSTPTTITLFDDDEFHELQVEKMGYGTAVLPILPEDRGPTLRIVLEPERLARGTLTVDSNSMGEVWLDGVDTGFSTPTLGFRVPVGEHTVEVHAEGMLPAGTRITVKQGQTRRLTLPLIPQPGLSQRR